MTSHPSAGSGADPASGPRVYRYPDWFFLGITGFALILTVGVLVEPPKGYIEIFGGAVLGAYTLFLCVHSRLYRLELRDGVILRHSPWPSDQRHREFALSSLEKMEMRHKATHITLVTRSGEECDVPLLFTGSIRLLRFIAEHSDASPDERVQNLIRRFS